MADAGGLGFCLDESMGGRIAATLRIFNAPGAPAVYYLRELLGLSNTPDEVWMPAMGQHNIHAVVTLDSNILRASVRRDVWRVAGLSLFVMGGEWGNLRLFEQARMVIWWWPAIVAQAEAGPQGGAWEVPLETRTMRMRRLFADPP